MAETDLITRMAVLMRVEGVSGVGMKSGRSKRRRVAEMDRQGGEAGIRHVVVRVHDGHIG